MPAGSSAFSIARDLQGLDPSAISTTEPWHACASTKQHAAEVPSPSRTFHERSEALWDDFLEALDGYLKQIQDRHIRAVEDTGTSGR
jgi:hypothetical protein